MTISKKAYLMLRTEQALDKVRKLEKRQEIERLIAQHKLRKLDSAR